MRTLAMSWLRSHETAGHGFTRANSTTDEHALPIVDRNVKLHLLRKLFRPRVGSIMPVPRLYLKSQNNNNYTIKSGEDVTLQ